jgi:aminotransferase
MPRLAGDLAGIINHKLDALQPSPIRAFDAKISKIPGIIKLTIGEPDLNTPDHVKAAAIKDIQKNDTHYAPQTGKPEFKQAIANYLQRTRGVSYNPDGEILVTVGATEGAFATMSTLLNTGDKVILPTPLWSPYFKFVQLPGGTPVQVDTSADGFMLTPEKLEAAIEREGKGVKAVVLNYPSNPTGREYSADQLEALAKVIAKHHLYAVTDEIYSKLVYGVKHTSIAKFIPERTILISGLSKSHAMTGWRCGYVAGPAEIIKEMAKFHALSVMTVTDNVQAAGTEALNNGDADALAARDIYQKRRDLMVAGLEKMGFKMMKPQGAFYIFPEIPVKYGTDDVKFCEELAEKAKVGLTPGSAFGLGGAGHVRLSYAASTENLQTCLDRIKQFLAKN